MDLDAFIARNAPVWRRLDELSARRRLSADESDELVLLYRRVTTQLSTVQSRTPEPALAARLSAILARARAAAVGTPRVSGWQALARGARVDFPVAVYRAWRWWVSTALTSIAVAAAMMLWLRAHPERLNNLIGSAAVRQLVNHDFADYYSQSAAQDFAGEVWTHNVLVAALVTFTGITVIGPVYFLWESISNLGVVGGAMLAAGKPGLFFGLILPHGMLELTAVFVATGAGLQLGWSWVAPGDLPRVRSLAAAGRRAGVIAVGLVPTLLVSGIIEAFVTPSGLPTSVRITIGVLAEVAFLSYVFVLGRRGVAAHATGDLTREELGDQLPV